MYSPAAAIPWSELNLVPKARVAARVARQITASLTDARKRKGAWNARTPSDPSGFEPALTSPSRLGGGGGVGFFRVAVAMVKHLSRRLASRVGLGRVGRTARSVET